MDNIPEWTTFLSEFDFDKRHLKCQENQVERFNVCMKFGLYNVEFDVTQLKEVALKDPECKFLWHQTMQMQDSGKPT